MSERVIDRPFLIAAVISLSTGLVFYLLLTTMAVYAVERFSASDAIAGIASTSFILGAVAARLAATPLLRAFGRRSVIVVGSLLSVVLTVVYPFVDGVWQLIAIRLLHGAAFGVVTTLIVSGVLSRAPAGRRAEVAGYIGLPPTIATAAGPFLAIALLTWGGYEVLFGGAIACTAVAAVAAIFLRLPDGRAEGGVQADRRRERVRVSAEARALRKKIWGLAIVILLVGFAYSGVIAYLTAYATQLDAEWSVGVYFALYAILAFAGRLFLGRIQDRRGDNVIVFPTLTAFAISLALLALAPSGVMIALAGVFMGLGFGSFLPTMQAAAAALVPDEHINSSVAAVYVSMDLGVGLAPIALGAVIAATGYQTMYGVLAVLVLVAGGLYAIGHARTSGGAPQ